MFHIYKVKISTGSPSIANWTPIAMLWNFNDAKKTVDILNQEKNEGFVFKVTGDAFGWNRPFYATRLNKIGIDTKAYN
ncbi:MAG: hypothetical protein HWQ36_26255 [Nostoc sp. NMS2]|uniref:hypothetical protein n=1 Tax=Nostoc sp. NMS2 TaxID=2815389 RepID=UPI0026006029|nr:hypothetical protein [Nostoc sp. NMS2]MBN3993891.1 hypothetical protein [Nostoc sp. NMS2]